MSNILFVNGAIRQYVKQNCTCSESYPKDYLEFGTTTWKTVEEASIQLHLHTNVCHKCGTPYKTYLDTSNCVLVKSIGDENA